MIDQDKKIRKGLPPRRDVACYQTLNDIVIPAGTILRNRGDGKFGCAIGHHAEMVLEPPQGLSPDGFKRVVA